MGSGYGVENRCVREGQERPEAGTEDGTRRNEA